MLKLNEITSQDFTQEAFEGWYYGREDDRHMVSCGPTSSLTKGGIDEKWLFDECTSESNNISFNHAMPDGGANEDWLLGNS